MAIYITLDAGGTKCNAIMFDDELNILGRGLSGGVNTTQTSPEDSHANIVKCIEQLFSDFCPDEIACIYTSFVGPVEVLLEELGKRTRIASSQILGEPKAGMLAGALRREGMLAIAGTGSDVFYITEQRDPGRSDVVGAYGPILSDYGSGTWIGQQALRAAVSAYDGWTPETMLTQMIMDEWQINDVWGMVNRIHGSVAPFRTVASVAPIVGRAARAGDAVALDIIKSAGDVMAEQALCLMRRRDEIPPDHRCMVVCGGAWKVHPLMFETFRDRIQAVHPEVDVIKPCFEHVMAGPVLLLLERGMSCDEVRALLSEKFSEYVIKW